MRDQPRNHYQPQTVQSAMICTVWIKKEDCILYTIKFIERNMLLYLPSLTTFCSDYQVQRLQWLLAMGKTKAEVASTKKVKEPVKELTKAKGVKTDKMQKGPGKGDGKTASKGKPAGSSSTNKSKEKTHPKKHPVETKVDNTKKGGNTQKKSSRVEGQEETRKRGPAIKSVETLEPKRRVSFLSSPATVTFEPGLPPQSVPALQNPSHKETAGCIWSSFTFPNRGVTRIAGGVEIRGCING